VSTFSPSPRQPPPHRLRCEVRGASAGPTLGSFVLILLGAATYIWHLRRHLRAAVYEAGHDKLTGLPNRRSLFARLADGPVGLVGLVDLDGFKDVNDRYGHGAGDHLLRAFATRLHHALGERGMVARLGGDEFVILWTHQPSEPLVDAQQLMRRTLRPVTIQGRPVQPAASIGLALPGPHLRGEALLCAAEHATYDAKKGTRVHLYAGAEPPGPIDRATIGRRSARQRSHDGPLA
jgi:diguanylate cyclase (GGDEF)-like protein